MLVRGDITTAGYNGTQVALKTFATFIKCITKIDGTTIHDVEDLDLVMPMYNLLKCNLNYFNTTCSLQFHCEDEATNFNAWIVKTNAFKS